MIIIVLILYIFQVFNDTHKVWWCLFSHRVKKNLEIYRI
jgi:hypothetical protein